MMMNVFETGKLYLPLLFLTTLSFLAGKQVELVSISFH